MQFSRFGRYNTFHPCAYRSAPAVRAEGEVPKERKPVPSGIKRCVLRRFTCNPRAFHAGKPAVLNVEVECFALCQCSTHEHLLTSIHSIEAGS